MKLFRTTLLAGKVTSSREQILAGIILLIGLLLRLRQYLTARSLWEDEAMLALNIVNRNFADLFKPLDYDQGAPIGFLLVEKFFHVTLGKNELVLRFFPLLAGIACLWLFYLLIKQTTKGAGLLTALALFVVNPQLIYYSSEVKQYIVDVAVALGLLVLASPIFQSQARRQDFLRLGLAGMIALWFSHPALFVLAGIGVALFIMFFQQRDFSNLRLTIGTGILWLVNLGLLYFITLRDLSHNQFLIDYWEGAFLPMPPWSDLNWFVKILNDSVHVQLGIQYAAWLVFTGMLAGWLLLFREKQIYANAIASILFFAFIASALRLYPVSGRLSLFLIPFGFILLAKTVEAIYTRLDFNKWLSNGAALILGGFLIYSPFVTSLQYFIAPKYFEHIRPAMEYLSASWKDGDVIFVSYGALPAFRFYAPDYGLEGIHYASSENTDYADPKKLASRLEPFTGQKRVWILFSHVYEKGNFNERDFLLDRLSQIGEERREFRQPGTSVYLYLFDLSK